MARQEYRIERVDGREGASALRLAGRLDLQQGATLWDELQRELPSSGEELEIDLSELESADGASVSLLLALRATAIRRGAAVNFTGAGKGVAKMLELYGCPTGFVCLQAPPRKTSMLDNIGRSAIDVLQRGKDVLEFMGDQLVALGRAIREPRSVHWRDLGRLMERTGADGLPIVLLINFLIGLIIALQSAGQLQRFGASHLVADLVGVSVVRELAPLMTGIIVAGRSGAAFAAELGTMKVSEEVDALRTLGLDPQRFLVFPRLIALAVVVPILTLFGDIVGCIGGLAVAVYSLDITPVAYFNELQSALGPGDLVSGLIKSVAFALTIAGVACQRGLATRGGASGVGSSTTSAVVTILFLLIVQDALFAVLFDFVGI